MLYSATKATLKKAFSSGIVIHDISANSKVSREKNRREGKRERERREERREREEKGGKEREKRGGKERGGERKEENTFCLSFS